MTTKTSWASLDNKPAKPAKRGKTWDVDADQADAIYGQFTMFDRPKSRWSDLDVEPVTSADYYTAYTQQRTADPVSVARLKTAATMVQTFVDALSGEQSNYTVSIDTHSTTAYTDLRNRIMKLPAKTILDPEITEQEAALLMVAFLGHEIGHVRIDDLIDKALQGDSSIVEKGIYNSLSTILREAHVEAGFSAMFPGYAGLFEPMLRWISRGTKDGSVPPTDALGFAIAATRYPFRFDWSKPEHKAEAAWWVKWVDANSRIEDYPGHKTALDLAVAHINATLPKQDKPQDGEEEGDGGKAGDPGGTAQIGESLDAGESGEAGEAGTQGANGMQAGDGPVSMAEAEAEGEGESSKTSKTGSTTGAGGGGASVGDYSEAPEAPYSTASAQATSVSDLASAKYRIKNEAWQQTNALRQEQRDKVANGEEFDYGAMYDKIAEVEAKSKKDQSALTRNNNAAAKKSASIPASIEQVDQEQPKKKGGSRRSRNSDSYEVQEAAYQANRDRGLSAEGVPIKAAIETEPQSRVLGKVATDPEATGIFRSTFIRLRGGNDGRIGGKRSGRLDDRRIFRLADKRDDRVFTRRGAPKTQRLRVYLMVDTSGSMGGEPEGQIRSVAKALIEASFGADNLTLEVFGWDNTVAQVWQRGQDPDEVLRLRARGGTNDVASLKFATERMQKRLRQDEHGLIIMMSDGAGTGNEYLKIQAEKARALGMSVFGITMSAGLNQEAAYGKDGYIQWQGTVAKTAKPLAEIISQSWLTKDQHRD